MPELQHQLSCGGSSNVDSNGQHSRFCAGCYTPIQDRFFLQAADSIWHSGCLRCATCKVSLERASSCFSKHGFIYCKQDYFRLFGSKNCARCSLTIDSSELVMRVRSMVFHISCFACASCNRVLTTGEYFGMRDNIIYCQEDYDIIQRNTMSLIDFYTPSVGTRSMPAFYNGVGAVQKGRPRKKRVEVIDPTGLYTVEDYERGTDEYSLHSPPRQKRMRTSFKHHQLRTMKAYFGLNHNPDSKDLKQLSEKTGLSKRVLQVWFQNARAKYRRSLSRKELAHGDKSNDDFDMEDHLISDVVNDNHESSGESRDKLVVCSDGSRNSSGSGSLVALQSPALSDVSSNAISMLDSDLDDDDLAEDASTHSITSCATTENLYHSCESSELPPR